jgi:tetratricopeptide (TPR) repeat protein
MAQTNSETSTLVTYLTKEVPTLVFLVRISRPYDPDRRWGVFDSLGVRAIDDLTFIDGPQPKTIVAYTEEPPHPVGVRAITLPAQVALDRIFFHIQGISSVVINPRAEAANLSERQIGTHIELPTDFPKEFRIDRCDIPSLLGAYSMPQKKVSDSIERAERAFRENSLFEAFFLARKAREEGTKYLHRAWFIELMSMSFFGLADEAMALYEEYPLRGSSEAEAQLVAARYRLLLKQLNEARTILHGLTFNAELGAIAACELARSYLLSGEFDRAIDLATGAIQKNSSFVESYLVRGIAQRGLSYGSGDEEGLREALKDFELVAKRGDFSAPEASFHAGTIFGRLGALEEAEVALRQSLFQRDRYSSRDALVRVLCAAGKMDWANEELERVCAVAPSVTQGLREEVESHLTKGLSERSESNVSQGIWSKDPSTGAPFAVELVCAWGIPVSGSLSDCALLDDFINRYAPAGDFLAEGPGAPLADAGEAAVGRSFALYVGDLLVRGGVATWELSGGSSLGLITRDGGRIPLESFVQERLLVGASGDNFASLESLVAELQNSSDAPSGARTNWWQVASKEEVADFEKEAQWGRDKLLALGAQLSGGLSDLDEIDRVIEQTFEPGGMLQEFADEKVGDELDRFVASIGLVVGQLIGRLLNGVWYRHEQAEGVSLLVDELGRIFPIARMHRRVYLSTAADSTQKLGSFAFGVAAAVVTGRIRKGVYADRPHVVTAFLELLPQMSQFAEEELEGVADALLANARSLG